MNKRQIIALLSCLVVGMAGFAGAYTVEKSQEHTEQEAENQVEQERSQQASTIVNPKPATQSKPSAALPEIDESIVAEAQSESKETEAAETIAAADSEKDGEKEAETTEENTEQETEEQSVETAAVKDDAIHFAPQNGLRWPLEGDVLLNYSMEHRIYFPTLQQYQYNPALVIGGEVNDKVYIIAEGTITDISTNEETGCTVTEDLGDGYTAVYGQLKELNFDVGEHVERGQVIGYVSEPTKYYSVEGSNLYFAMQKDGEPIDPLEYYE